jgi:glutathione S-transferase
MSDLTIWTYDWVPQGPRGFVRDLRLRWACEEAELVYTVRSIPFEDRRSITWPASRSARSRT